MYEYKAKIIDVYDGDTFTFEVDLGFSITVKEKIRLAGINTPEVRGKSKLEGIVVRDYVREYNTWKGSYNTSFQKRQVWKIYRICFL